MRTKTYLWLTGLASLLALASFLAIIWFFSPQNASAAILILLFLSLFLALCGFFSLSALYFRRRKYWEEPLLHLGISFREGSLLSGLLVGFLLMRYFSIFSWWLALIFLIVVVAIELAFLKRE
jgi:FtsH-binding integral membrane protein